MAQPLYLVIANISKRPNVRKLVELAAAFNASILVVGQRKNWKEGEDDHHLVVPRDLQQSPSGLSIRRFDKWHELMDHLRRHRIRLVGVEIHPDAVSVKELVEQQQQQPRRGGDGDGSAEGMALVVGNEGTGLSDKQMASCDQFVRIPQYGAGTASLNVYTAASIVLYNINQQQQHQLQHRRKLQAVDGEGDLC